MMMGYRRTTLITIAALFISAGAAWAAAADGRLRLHAPVFVATPRDGSFITPYFFDYGGRSAYNSPGPVYYHLDGAGAQSSCRLWRYNYLYWVC
jgi:hypothetical protein